MSDWNTLHFFDDQVFYSKIVPDLKGAGSLLRKYVFSDLGKRLTGAPVPDSFAGELTAFCRELDDDFQAHTTLQKILERKREPGEELEGFYTKKMREADEYLKGYTPMIEYLNQVLPGMVFSECASFNPHLVLGRRIFSGAVEAAPKSIAADLLGTLIDGKTGIHSMFGRGFTGWITREELQLLWLDKANMRAADENSEGYFKEFLNLVETALDHRLGLISVTNVNEDPLAALEGPEWGKKLSFAFPGFQHIICREN